MTKRAIFMADIHGNITGLKAVLAEVKKLENVTHIVALGDYFGWSAGHNDILDECIDNGVILIRGGHEEILNIIDNGKDDGKYYPVIYFTHDWLKKNLTPTYYKMVTELPLEFRLKLNENDSIIAFHAALNDMESYSCGSDRPLEVLQRVYGQLDENIIIYGHYHEPHVIPMGSKTLINCAAVGARVRDNLSNYTIIEYTDEKIAIIQKQVPYSKQEEEQLIAERGMIRMK